MPKAKTTSSKATTNPKSKPTPKQPPLPAAPAGENETETLLVVGLDVSDKKSNYCFLDYDGEICNEGQFNNTAAGLASQFKGRPRMRVALEAGTHSHWMSLMLEEFGHEVIVANARKLRMIADSDSKNDRTDARTLARFARLDPKILNPIKHRTPDIQADLSIIRAREQTVAMRTQTVNCMRGLAKPTGHRLPGCGTSQFRKTALANCPPSLLGVFKEMAKVLDTLSEVISEFDREIETLAKEKYPESKAIQSIPGVAALTSLTMVLVMNNDRNLIKNSRDAGCYAGLKPKQRESGESSPQLAISKSGDRILRRLLVQSAQYMLGHFAKDCALRRWGLTMAERGGKRGKRRAVVAVARKLVVLMHRLWVTQEQFDPARGLPPAAIAA